MTPIKYVVGDATLPQGSGPRIIAHVCNDVGVWGAGFVLALSHRCFHPQWWYEDWSKTQDSLPDELNHHPFKLGEVQFTPYYCPTATENSPIYVCNMIAQRGVRDGEGGIPLQYEDLSKCLKELCWRAFAVQATVHMPRIGCGLAGGDWQKVERLIKKNLSAANMPVTIYDIPSQPWPVCGIGETQAEDETAEVAADSATDQDPVRV